MILFQFGCTTVQKQFEDDSHKASDTSADKEEEKPVLYEESENLGFVVDIKNYLPVKSLPSAQSATVGKLYLGDKVKIDSEQEQWCHIARLDQASKRELEGWVKKRYVEELPSHEQAAESLIDLTYIRGGGESSSMSSIPEDKHKDMKTRTKVEGTVAGAAAGAAIGALAGKVTSDDAVKGAMVGAAVGAVAGYAAGSYVAGQKEKYANDEEYLNAAIEEAARYNREAEARNDTLQEVIAATEQEITVLKHKIGEFSVRQQRAQANLRVMTRISQETKQRISELEGLVGAQEEAISDISKDTLQLKELENEMQITRDQIQDLKEKRNQLENLMGEMAEQTV
jgi:DNA repair exonuclease SbcCD ATPase subunit